MKKSLFIFLGVALASGAFAQTVPQKVKTTVHEKQLKGDIREKREDQKEVRKDLSKGKLKKAKADHKEVAEDQAEVNKDAAKLKKDGVAHPKMEAKKAIHNDSKAK